MKILKSCRKPFSFFDPLKCFFLHKSHAGLKSCNVVEWTELHWENSNSVENNQITNNTKMKFSESPKYSPNAASVKPTSAGNTNKYKILFCRHLGICLSTSSAIDGGDSALCQSSESAQSSVPQLARPSQRSSVLAVAANSACHRSFSCK